MNQYVKTTKYVFGFKIHIDSAISHSERGGFLFSNGFCKWLVNRSIPTGGLNVYGRFTEKIHS